MTNVNEIRQQMERLSNEELISIFLKHDEHQYRPEVFEIVEAILRERGVTAGKDLRYATGPKSALDETEGMNLKTVADYVSRLDAEEDRLILENEGVKAWIFEEENPPVEGMPSCVQLKVCAEDWRAAMERLGAEDMLLPDAPDDFSVPPCPRCGSRKVIEKAEMAEEWSEFTATDRSQEWLYYCVFCGRKWPDTK